MSWKTILLLIILLSMSGCLPNTEPNGNINIDPGIIRDPTNGNIVGVDENGRLGTVQHAHPYQIPVHFHIENLGTGTYRYILASKNLIPFLPNQTIEYLHMEWLQLQVDSDVNGDYAINFGFIENVTNVSSSRYIVKHFDGSKSAGNQILEFQNYYPNGWRMGSEHVITHGINMTATAYNNLTALPSAYDPLNATIIPDNGDIILEIVINGGTINVAADIGIHPDSAGTD